MITPLRTRLDELEVYVTRVAEATGIPPAHLEKDFWVTEVLRGASNASGATGCSVIFKGGTSLSKAHRIIERFSEDVDLVVVLPEGGKSAKDSTLKTFVAAAESTTGVEGTVDPSSATKGVKRTATFAYPTTHSSALKPGVLMELSTRGGALPYRRLPIQSLISEHAAAVDLPIDFKEAAPVNLLVLKPVRTLAEKLILLHHAAIEGDTQRRAATARHYYDVDRLLHDDDVLSDLRSSPIDLLAREVTEHSRAAGLPTAMRPREGFSASPAWDPSATNSAEAAYSAVMDELLWPGAPHASFAECCHRVHELAELL